MKLQTLFKASLLSLVLAAGTFQAWAGQQRVFEFTGQVNAFNRSGGTLVVEDLVFRVLESTQVYKPRGTKGMLSDIKPGTRVGFYPGSGGSSYVNEIWILPSDWQAAPGYAVTPDN